MGLRVDPARVEIRWAPLVDLIALAYGVERYQIAGPDWVVVPKPWDPHIFDIQATIPEGASRNDVPEMLRSLLEDRFRLIAHREMRPMMVYALEVGEGGPKLKDALPDASPTATPPPNQRLIADYEFDGGNHLKGTTTGTTDTLFIEGPDGNMKITTETAIGGTSHIDAYKAGIPWLAKQLAHICDLPVVDATSLKGYYRFTLDLPKPGTAPSDVSMRAISASLRRLGLKVERKQLPFEHLVIGHVNGDPTPN